MSNRQRVVSTDRNSFFLNKNNPYIELSTTNPDETMDRTLVDNEQGIGNSNNDYVETLPADFIDRAIKIDKYTCSIRFICLFDLFINLFYMVYGYIFGFIFSIVALCGYYSTIYHNRNMLFCYLVYQYLQSIAKSLNLAIIITIYANYNMEHNNVTTTNSTTNNRTVVNNNSLVDMTTLDKDEFIPTLLVSIVILLCQFYVNWVIQVYYKLLPTNDEKNILRNGLLN